VWPCGRLYCFHLSRDIAGTIKTLTIKGLATGRMEIIFSCLVEEESHIRVKTGQTAGFDFGLTTFLTGHNGHDIHAPQPLRQSLRAVRKPSAPWRARCQGRSTDAKPNRPSLACIAGLPINAKPGTGTQHGRCASATISSILRIWSCGAWLSWWGRKVADVGFGRFVQILHQAAEKFGTHVHHVDRFVPCVCDGRAAPA